MDEHTAFLIRSSIAKLTPMAERVDVLFNERLLDIYPDVYRLFALDISPEERKLTETISIVLVHLGYFGAILPTVKALAPSQRIFRLVEMYYDALGETLIWTLRRSLGAGFSSEVERAWNSALSRSSRARLRVVASRD
ncbi:MAG: hypothetical protein EKK31_12060 [Hyphomicrobiales bacterium]|nr:MAG: hypothetical protein EKK31_12060 [Hyphomicrobiales bacterium]